jgi:hypothetical protein
MQNMAAARIVQALDSVAEVAMGGADRRFFVRRERRFPEKVFPAFIPTLFREMAKSLHLIPQLFPIFLTHL